MGLQAEAPEYRRSPRSQTTREIASKAAAKAMANGSVAGVSRPMSAWAGTVVANATGTRNVSVLRSQGGWTSTGQRPPSQRAIVPNRKDLAQRTVTMSHTGVLEGRRLVHGLPE
jgi:hypothetical protein